MTARLYYEDAYQREFEARVVEAAGDGRRLYLDRTAFYPASGGQPADSGALNGIDVVDVIDEEDRIAHLLASPLTGQAVMGTVDWARRFDHMQQHSGQHLLSAVLEDLFGIATVSFHLGETASTIDLASPSLSVEQILRAESRANEVVWENRPLTVRFEDAARAEGLRKPSQRAGEIRVVSIEGIDRSACGGTHVRATGEIGAVLLRKLDKVRASVRLEFLCGGRALRRARSDYDALSRVARVFSSTLEDAPALVAAQAEQVKDAGKQRKKLALELAERRGREVYEACTPSALGRRLHVERRSSGGFDDELRALARSFTAQPGAMFVAACDDPPSLLCALAADSGLRAGEALQALLARHGGRGGGTPQMAQGSLPDAASLAAALAELTAI